MCELYFVPQVEVVEGAIVDVNEFGFMIYGLKDGLGSYTDDNGYERMGEDWLEGMGAWEPVVDSGITFNNVPANYEYEACQDGSPNCPPDLCHNGFWMPDPYRTTWVAEVPGTGIESGLEPSWVTLDLGSAGADFVRSDTDGMVTFVVS